MDTVPGLPSNQTVALVFSLRVAVAYEVRVQGPCQSDYALTLTLSVLPLPRLQRFQLDATFGNGYNTAC